MRRTSLFARLCSIAAAFSLVFAQLAVAGFACPGDADPGNPGTNHLCLKVCQDEPRKNDVPSLATLPPAADTGLRVDPPSPRVVRIVAARTLVLERATSPPPVVLYAHYLK